jgi:hypothetical protein
MLPTSLWDHGKTFCEMESGATCVFAAPYHPWPPGTVLWAINSHGVLTHEHHISNRTGPITSWILPSECSPYSEKTVLVITPGLFRVQAKDGPRLVQVKTLLTEELLVVCRE